MRPDDGRGQRLRRLLEAVSPAIASNPSTPGAGTTGGCDFAILLVTDFEFSTASRELLMKNVPNEKLCNDGVTMSSD